MSSHIQDVKWEIDEVVDNLSNKYCLEPGFVLKNFVANHSFMEKHGVKDPADNEEYKKKWGNCQASGHDIWQLRCNPAYQGIDLIVYGNTVQEVFEKMSEELKAYFESFKEEESE